MLVVYLDPYFLGDPLFVPGLARDLAARGSGLILVHGSGERGERALERLGHLPTAADGVWQVTDAESSEAVERATRELNREILHELNEAGVPAIRMTGADRGLLVVGETALTTGRTDWLRQSVEAGVTIVLAALAERDGKTVEVDAARATGLLADALDLPSVALTTRSVGPDERLAEVATAVPDAGALQRLAREDGAVAAGPRALLRATQGQGFASFNA